MIDQLQKDLETAIDGQVHFDSLFRRIYSVDASIYEVEPLGVVVPKSQIDLVKILQIASRYRIPVIARGAATGIAGGCIGPGLIVDCSKYLNRILEINFSEEYVVCQPGVIQDRLNEELAKHGYRLGPDTSTGNRATLGGMLASNAAGARSLRYGKMVDHIHEVVLALAGGETIVLRDLSNEEFEEKKIQANHEGQIYQAIASIKNEYTKDVEQYFPKIPRRVSGYNLDELYKSDRLNLSKLIAGSEGTLGIVLEMKLKIVRKPTHTGLCLIHANDLLGMMYSVPQLLSHKLLSLEMLDSKILSTGRGLFSIQGKLEWLIGDPEALLIAEVEGDSDHHVQEQLNEFAESMRTQRIGYAQVLLTDPSAIKTVWELRKAGLGLLLSKRSYNRAVAFIEDVTVAPEKLGPFMRDFLLCLKKFDKEAGIYGHVGAGCMHIRPYVDLRSPTEQKLMQEMMLAVADLLLEHGGALSGEHGDGYIRSWLNEKMFGSRIYGAFCALKSAFDPGNLLNPGKVVHSATPLHDLRSYSNSAGHKQIKKFLDFTAEGGLELAADLCNGNGLCRKSENVMCPSFQATGSEFDTTRARAQALRAIFHGHWPDEDLSSQKLHDVLDLCLQCKGCKHECPSQVDMAKMKSEALYHYHQKHGHGLRTKIFGSIRSFNRYLAPMAPFINWISNMRVGKNLQRIFGIARKRTLPPLASQTFSQWFKHHKNLDYFSRKHKILMFVDTFTEYNHPEIGRAAVAVFQAFGYDVELVQEPCCGRTFFSKGMLEQAKKLALSFISQMQAYREQNLPIIVLEPSCLSMFKDDFQGLLGENEIYDKIRPLMMSFGEFMDRELKNPKSVLFFKGETTECLIHGHCHQKSLGDTNFSLHVLNTLPGCQASLINTGCCGMAGSFGYEREHYDISMQIGMLQLFPAIHKADTDVTIVTDGVSCRQQIFDGTGRRAMHLAEFVASRLNRSL